MLTSRRGRILLSLGGVVIIVLIAVLYVVLTHHQKLSQVTKSSYKSAKPIVPYTTNHAYTYKDLNSFNLKTTHPGANLAFSKPVELKPFGQVGVNGTSDQVLLIHSAPDHTIPDYSRIAAAASYSTQAFTPSTLTAIASSAKPDNSGYSTFVGDQKTFISQRLPYGFDKLTLSTPQVFSSGNIASNAWLTSFTAVSSKLKNAKGLKGEMIEAYGKQTIYYFMVDNIASDWPANQAVWQKVEASLKIDQ
ncbi:MAG TPA: hypothetical protein VFP35_01440 [Candidatus Saccharimonadales bacterium]|nr:hypothetical protein [Candidatus Saccharimonadales bacterium]